MAGQVVKPVLGVCRACGMFKELSGKCRCQMGMQLMVPDRVYLSKQIPRRCPREMEHYMLKEK